MLPKEDRTNALALSRDFCDVASVHGFPELFGYASRLLGKTSIRYGSTLLLSGPPGAGKTTCALATLRAMMAEANRVSKEKRGSEKQSRTIAYYISSEVSKEQLKDNFHSFGWFQDPNALTNEAIFKFWADDPQPDK